MKQVFISCKFDKESIAIARLLKSKLKEYKINAIISDNPTSKSVAKRIRIDIKESSALVAIVTENIPWIHNEIGMAYANKIPIYVLKNESVKSIGLIPYVTSYQQFNKKSPKSIEVSVTRISKSLVNEVRFGDEFRATILKNFKNKREELAYEIGAHAGGSQLFLLLLANDVNPLFWEDYRKFYEWQIKRLLKELNKLKL